MVMTSSIVNCQSSNHVHNDHLNRSLERAIEEATRTGELLLSARKLRQFPSSSDLKENFDLTDTIRADLSRNRLTEFPSIFCSFPSLEYVNLYQNVIRSIPEQIETISLLKTIDLSRNQLTSIPDGFCRLKFLEVLILNNNKISALPEQIDKLERLIELDVSANDLKRLPRRIVYLSSLRSLNLRRNKILELPNDFSRLKLTNFDCSSNELTELPLNLREMSTLVELNVEQNPLKCPPSSICGLGLLHIMRYLMVESIKQEKQRGVLTENEINAKYRNSVFYQSSRNSNDSQKVETVPQSDSGYLTTEASERTLFDDESNFDVFKPHKSGTSEQTSMVALADEFSKELARQKFEYERKKNQAQELKRHLLQRLGETETQRMKTREIARRVHQEKLEKIERQRQDARRKMENSRTLALIPCFATDEETSSSMEKNSKSLPIQISSSMKKRATSVETTNRKELGDLTSRCERFRRISVEENSTETREDQLLIDQLRKMIENRLKIRLPDDLGAAINDGVVLCHFINQIRPSSVQIIHVPSAATPKLPVSKSRRNIENFLEASRRLGVPEVNLCSVDEIIDGKNLVRLARQIRSLIANQYSQQTQMSFTADTKLPTYEELECPVVNVTSAVLRAASFHLAKYCDFQFKEFMLCRQEEQDPRKCLKEGKEVSLCSMDFFHQVRGSCNDSFSQFWKCVDTEGGGEVNFKKCRAQQAAFEDCAKTKMNLERPEQGFFSMVRMHDTKRPAPADPFRLGSLERHPPKMEVPDPPKLSQADEYPEAKTGMKFGPRKVWMYESKQWD